MKKIISSLLFAFALLGCLGDNIVTGPTENPPGNTPNTPAACIDSELCRFENPADTSQLTSEQKATAEKVLKNTPDSGAIGLAHIRIADLQNEMVSINFLNDQKLVVDSSVIKLSGSNNHEGPFAWFGYINGSSQDGIFLVFVDGEFNSGWIKIANKRFLLIPLGGNAIIIQETEYEYMEG